MLRLEFIGESQMKGALIGVWWVEALALVGLLTGVGLKSTKVPFRSNQSSQSLGSPGALDFGVSSCRSASACPGSIP